MEAKTSQNNKPATDAVILCGGTGGHFHPGLGVALELKRRGRSVTLLLAGKNSPAQLETAKQAGVQALDLGAVGAPVGLTGKIRFLAQLPGIFKRARLTLAELDPKVVLGMGGFTSIPAALAATTLKIPLFLHDGNALAGKANVALSRFARDTLLAFPPVNENRIHSPWSVVGMPLREEIIKSKFKNMPRKRIFAALSAELGAKLKPDKPTVLVFGGSQGAAFINTTVPNAIKRLGIHDIQVVHLSGMGKLDDTLSQYTDAPFQVVAREFSSRMDLLLAAADIAVCRAGGATIAELDFFAKYAILIPLPTAADNHQEDNARIRADAGAAKLVIQSPDAEKKIAKILTKFVADPKYFAEQAANAPSGEHEKAAARVADQLEKIIS